MKKFVFTVFFVLAATTIMAQETYLNDYTTSRSDLFGTARYVGMGGAMGALGADLGAISSNPASIGMMRRSSLSLTFGGIRQSDSNTDGEPLGWFSVDQAGFVFSFPSDDMSFVNFAFNYQKKNNLTHTFIADNCGTSLLNHIGGVDDAFANTNVSYINPVVETAYDAGLLPYPMSEEKGDVYEGNGFKRVIDGHTQAYDFNLSGNYNNRFFWGITIGLENLRYKSMAMYDEYWTAASGLPYNYKDFSFNNYQNIKGTGFNLKVGAIVRPIESSPFRIGFAIETPTWYQIDSEEDCEFLTRFDQKHNFTDNIYDYYSGINTLSYKLHTPWRFRLSAGHTFGTNFAVGAEYEYADHSATTMAYPEDGYNNELFGNENKDAEMNRNTSRSLTGVHALKVGMEYKPMPCLALRAGYNYYSASAKKDGEFDPALNSYGLEFVSYTDYMHLGDVNILTLGVGYADKHFYVDAAYKYRVQGADFYPYCDYYLSYNPTRLNLDRHQLMFTLGYKF